MWCLSFLRLSRVRLELFRWSEFEVEWEWCRGLSGETYPWLVNTLGKIKMVPMGARVASKRCSYCDLGIVRELAICLDVPSILHCHCHDGVWAELCFSRAKADRRLKNRQNSTNK